MTRIRFEDLPSTNTPRNAENLNKLNNVVISSTEPTTGEEVWIQKGKNLLNTPYTESNKLTFTAVMDDHAIVTGYYCFLEAGKVYMFSCKSDATWGGAGGTDTVEMFLIKDKSYDKGFVSLASNPVTFTVPSTGVYFLRVDINQNGKTHSFWDFQIEEGNEKTPFEPYIDKKIYTKNDNGVYDEFYNEDEVNKQVYSTEEQRVGTWINGKPLYRKVISIGSVPAGQQVMNSTGITNLDTMVSQRKIAIVGVNYSDTADIFAFGAGTYYSAYNANDNMEQCYLTLEYTKTTD